MTTAELYEKMRMAMMKKSSTEQLLARPTSSSSESEQSDGEEEMVVKEEPPPTWSGNKKRLLSKQLSMRETTREANWEKRRRQIMQRRRMMIMEEEGQSGEAEEEEEGGRTTTRWRSLTDEDLDELRGSIELGFGFKEDGGHHLCHTLPALDVYFAVNRQFSDPKLRFSPSPLSTPTGSSSSSSSSLVCSTPSPRSPNHSSPADSWKICNPGDTPQHVKTRLRHWAQAVACSVRQCS